MKKTKAKSELQIKVAMRENKLKSKKGDSTDLTKDCLQTNTDALCKYFKEHDKRLLNIIKITTVSNESGI